MTTLIQHDPHPSAERRTWAQRLARSASRKPAVGRPVLFAVMLGIAALLLLGVLIAGPALSLPVMIAAAGGALSLVVLGWAVAGPRL